LLLRESKQHVRREVRGLLANPSLQNGSGLAVFAGFE
jgi:hypothetical protein